MKNIIYIGAGLVLLGGMVFGGYSLYLYWQDSQTTGNGEDIVIVNPDQKPLIVRSDFYENFRDGKIDDFWKWDDAGIAENKVAVDYVREELTLNAGPQTSQWTSSDSAPILSFLTDQNFQLTVNFNFSPKVDFQHAGIGLFDTGDNNWIRMSRAYDSHALETDLDLADSLYVMEKNEIDGVKKYKHVNYIDSKIYMRMTKENNLVLFEYSRDGIKWDKLDEVQKDNFADQTEVYLFGYSTEKVPVKVIFKEIDFDVL